MLALFTLSVGHEGAYELLVDESLAEVADGYNDDNLDEDALLESCVSPQSAYYACYTGGGRGSNPDPCYECGPCCPTPEPTPATLPAPVLDPGRWKDLGPGSCVYAGRGSIDFHNCNGTVCSEFVSYGEEYCRHRCGASDACGAYQFGLGIHYEKCVIFYLKEGEVRAGGQNWGGDRCIVKLPSLFPPTPEPTIAPFTPTPEPSGKTATSEPTPASSFEATSEPTPAIPMPEPTETWKDTGMGSCRVVENGKPVEAPTNYKYFGGCGGACCEGKCGGKACGGYEVSDDGNCLIWLTTPGQVLAADSSMNWGNARCIVKVPGLPGLRSIKTKNAPKRASERRRFASLQDLLRL